MVISINNINKSSGSSFEVNTHFEVGKSFQLGTIFEVGASFEDGIGFWIGTLFEFVNSLSLYTLWVCTRLKVGTNFLVCMHFEICTSIKFDNWTNNTTNVYFSNIYRLTGT